MKKFRYFFERISLITIGLLFGYEFLVAKENMELSLIFLLLAFGLEIVFWILKKKDKWNTWKRYFSDFSNSMILLVILIAYVVDFIPNVLVFILMVVVAVVLFIADYYENFGR